MNKKILILIVALLIVVGIVFIYINVNKETSSNKETLNKSANKSSDNQNDSNSGSEVLVLYFSATNNTKKIANYIAELTDGTITEIVPEEAYTDEDLNYNNDKTRANQEQNDESSRPKIKNKIDIENYNTIYLGFPIWWGDVPKIILTLMDTYDFSNKTIIAFCTSGGSGIETSINTLQNYQSNLIIKDGKRFSSSSTKNDVENWLNSR